MMSTYHGYHISGLGFNHTPLFIVLRDYGIAVAGREVRCPLRPAVRAVIAAARRLHPRGSLHEGGIVLRDLDDRVFPLTANPRRSTVIDERMA